MKFVQGIKSDINWTCISQYNYQKVNFRREFGIYVWLREDDLKKTRKPQSCRIGIIDYVKYF